MALTSTLSIADEANVAVSFTEIERNGTRVRRIAGGTTLALPTNMVVSHNQTGSGNAVADRHLVQFTKTVEDASGNDVTTVLNLTISVPRNAPAGSDDAKELVGYLINFLLDANAARTLASHLPSILLGES